MRYLMPLLPPGAIFQSNASSKSRKASLVNRSSVMCGRAVAFRHPSSMVKESPGGDFLVGSSQLAKVLPSKSNRQPAAFSCAVSSLSAARATAGARSAHASAAPQAIVFIPILWHAAGETGGWRIISLMPLPIRALPACALALLAAHAQQAQNPSPMVEHTRAHLRLAE